jgi:hypothetical protein
MKDYPPSEIRETWRNRGYGEPGDTRQAHHWRSGNPGGSAFGYGQARYGMEDGESPEDRYRPGAVPARPVSRRLPKNYQRTDARIRDDLCERLARAGDDVSDVTVDVGSGIVTLTGTVAERGIKYRIEELAEDVLGVNEVRNNVHVARSAGGAGGAGGGQRATGTEGDSMPGQRRLGQSAGRGQAVGEVASDVLYIVQSRDGRFLGAESGEAVLVPMITQAGLFDDPDEARAAAQEHCSRGYRILATRR